MPASTPIPNWNIPKEPVGWPFPINKVTLRRSPLASFNCNMETLINVSKSNRTFSTINCATNVPVHVVAANSLHFSAPTWRVYNIIVKHVGHRSMLELVENITNRWLKKERIDREHYHSDGNEQKHQIIVVSPTFSLCSCQCCYLIDCFASSFFSLDYFPMFVSLSTLWSSSDWFSTFCLL